MKRRLINDRSSYLGGMAEWLIASVLKFMWKSEYKSLQGNIGLGAAIAHYTSIGIPVSLPLNDTQKYDLVIDRGSLLKVSIKTTSSKAKSGNYIVQLRNTGGSSGKYKVRKFIPNEVDILFVLTEDGNKYEIPTSLVYVGSALTLTADLDKFKL